MSIVKYSAVRFLRQQKIPSAKEQLSAELFEVNFYFKRWFRYGILGQIYSWPFGISRCNFSELYLKLA